MSDWYVEMTGAYHDPRFGIEGQVGEAKRPLRCVAPTQESTHAGQELVERERMNEIVVCARIEPGHAVTHAVSGTQGQQRKMLRLLLAQAPGKRLRGLLARREIDDNGIRGPGPDDAHCLGRARGESDVIPLARKRLPEFLGATRNRLHNEHASLEVSAHALDSIRVSGTLKKAKRDAERCVDSDAQNKSAAAMICGVTIAERTLALLSFRNYPGP